MKGISALQMGRDLGMSHKTAYVLLHKIRESLLGNRDESALTGQVHVDGAYVGGKVRPENKNAHEMAYREDTRRWSNGHIFLDIVGKCVHALVSRDGSANGALCGHTRR